MTDENVNVVDLENQAGEAPVVKLCNAILLSAIKKKASDIHVEPYEKSLRVRFRIDGILQEEMRPPLKLRNAITSRLKIMASLDIAERRLPQDGRIKLKIGGNREMDFRVSVLPTLYGEKIVMRLLDKSTLQLDVTKLGFDIKPLEDFKSRSRSRTAWCSSPGRPVRARRRRCTRRSPSSTRSIATSRPPKTRRVQPARHQPGADARGHRLNFATALRAFLRQDPNIIMVGEIRDFETAEIAVKAALTGTSCCRRCTRTTPRRRCRGSSTWASSRSS